MELCDLPDDLPSVPAVVLQGDPDGERERAAFALLPHDVVGSARLALTIQNRFRRAAWLRGFRSVTIALAQEVDMDQRRYPESEYLRIEGGPLPPHRLAAIWRGLPERERLGFLHSLDEQLADKVLMHCMAPATVPAGKEPTQ